MDDYIDVKIDVFEHTGQRARVRRGLTVSALIEEILREFDDITADSPEKYALYLKGFDRPLTPPTNTLTQFDIQPQDELVFDYVRQTIRRMLEPYQYAVLREEVTGKEFDIQWQPAVIGRPSTDVDHNIMLAANVQLLPDGKTVSRRHAQITFSEGRYFIEPLAEQNPVFLNGKELPVNSKREIRNNDRLSFGRSKLTMTFLTQSQRDSRPSMRESVSKPISRPIAESVASPVLPHSAPTAREPAATSFVPESVSAALVIEAASASDRVGQRIELIAFPFTIGRMMTALSAEGEVSRKHAEITRDAQSGTYYITDLQSTNGVTVNGQRIPPNTPHLIAPGARIGLGQVLVMRFEA
jgi:pSer/pThr/pTyr-binding forkhead associated (FHA) protein